MVDESNEIPSFSMPENGPPKPLPVLPMSDLVLFPGMVAPLSISTTRSMRLIDEVTNGHRFLILALQRDRNMSDEKAGLQDIYPIGCVARLLKMLKFPDETIRVLVQGVERCRIDVEQPHAKYLQADYTLLKDDTADQEIELTALARNASQRFQEVITLSPTLPEELKIAVFNTEHPGRLADLIAAHLNMSLEDRQDLLADTKPLSRMRKLSTLLGREFEVLRLGTEIQHKVSETVAKGQREFFLREQLKQIRKELGEEDASQADVRDLDAKLAKAQLPKEVADAAQRERQRLQQMNSASPEYSLIRTYLEWISELPWSTVTEDQLDIRRARRVLDEDHYGLKKIKERILEYLAVLKLKADMKGPILCFVGPPGVGKTSLGQSIARALGRKFVRMSLGGMHDEAEIRGHRRTYIGALPGRIIQGLRKAGSANPVFMLDEVDKIGQDFRGDPSAALLEVLDPAQNHAFSDHYLNVPFDLSKVMFITTANMLDPVPDALRDRMEVLELSGYTRLEKARIAEKYLIPRQIREHGLTPAQITFANDTIDRVIEGYTREAGVRNLDREIAHLCRKVARNIAEGGARRATIRPADLHAMLGPRVFDTEVAERKAVSGVATGLAWTPNGGDILFVETTHMPGKGNLILTGLLGDVMKESARAAMSYIRANGRRWGLPEDKGDEDVHVHVPAGAIPKDGPSAGLAIVAALISMLSGKTVPADTAMTGEISLRGKVMPVGGIKEKVLAAHRAGIRRIMLPSRNRRNLEDVPKEVQRHVEFVFVSNIEDAVTALGLVPSAPSRKKTAPIPRRLTFK